MAALLQSGMRSCTSMVETYARLILVRKSQWTYELQRDTKRDVSAAAQASCGKSCSRALDKEGNKLERNKTEVQEVKGKCGREVYAGSPG